MSLQTLIDDVRGLAEGFLEDSCSIVDIQSAPDGYGGTTRSSVTIASDVPCLLESGGDLGVAVLAGTIVSASRATIFMQVTAETQSITPDMEIVVAARGDKPAMTFEDPRRLDESYAALLAVSAKIRV